MDRARASSRVLREVAFTAPLPRDGDGALGFAEGRIDLMFVEDGALGPEITVVDFKTDNIKRNEMDARTESYRKQALVYAWAAHETTRASGPRGCVPVCARAGRVGDRRRRGVHGGGGRVDAGAGRGGVNAAPRANQHESNPYVPERGRPHRAAPTTRVLNGRFAHRKGAAGWPGRRPL